MTAILLDDDREGVGGALLFGKPHAVICAHSAAEVGPALVALEAAIVEEGLEAAGFFAYELGYVLEPALDGLLPQPPASSPPLPLLWFALFAPAEVKRLDGVKAEAWLAARAADGGFTISAPRLQMSREAYGEKFARIKALIAAGEIYQLNLTLAADFTVEGTPAALYRALRRRQKVAHGAFIEAADFCILSLSPELFVQIVQGEIVTRPMKGTAARGRYGVEDSQLRDALQADEKTCAENLMITDLMRNDLARLALPGSVRVEDLFAVETYQTVHQMTSTVRARLAEGLRLADMLRALFPAGSIIGAPKIRAQQIIAALEERPRGVYTGAIGHLAPRPDGGGFDARFNVAIRTLLLRAGKSGLWRGEMGIGGGIVADSRCDAEWQECAVKMRFLSEERPRFQLIETLKYVFESGYVLLERHLDRLADSAAYFAFVCDIEAVREALLRHAHEVGEGLGLAARAGQALRVRLLLFEEGRFEITSQRMAAGGVTARGKAAPLRYVMAQKRVHSGDVFLYHKTTRRQFFDGERTRLAAQTGCDEVLFENERGELTEGSITSLFVRRHGEDVLLTPPLAAGLLPGTLRAELLACGQAREAVLRRADLRAAEAIYLGNSVRGLQPACPLASAGNGDGGVRPPEGFRRKTCP